MSGISTSSSPSGAAPHTGQAPLVNIANALTVLRLALVPVFVWLMLQPGDGMRLAATLVFIIASITDRLDGKIADPIADKALTLSAFILLSVAGRLWWWVTIVILVRELGITLMRFFMLRRAVMAASRGGKLKTVLQIAGLIGLLTPWAMFLPHAVATAVDLVAYVVVGAATVVTVVTGLDYAHQAVLLSRGGQADTTAGTARRDDTRQ